MKLKLKILSLALLLSLFITNTFNIFSVSAEEIPHLNLNELVQLGLEPLDLCDQRLVENDSFLNFTKNNPDVTLAFIEEAYYKVEIDSKAKAFGKTTLSNPNNIIKTKYTKEEYEAEETKNNNSDIDIYGVSGDKTFSWIYVRMYGHKSSNGRYAFSFAYEWLKQPFFQGKDAIVIGADSNWPIKSSTISGYHINKVSGKIFRTDYNWYSEDLKSRGANTYGINVNLTSTSLSTSTAYGAISCEAEPSQSNTRAGKVFGGYAHRQGTINFDFSFNPSDFSFNLGLSPGFTYDEATLSATMYAE